MLFASTTGTHINLDGMPYVGRDTVVSQRNVLNVELRTQDRVSAEGRFRCYVSATSDWQWSMRPGPVLGPGAGAGATPGATPSPGGGVSLRQNATGEEGCACGWKLDVSKS